MRGRLWTRGLSVLCAGLVLLASCASQPASTPQLDDDARIVVATAGPLEALAPRGQTDWPLTFSWSGTSDDSVVRIRIFDEAERPLFEIEARGTAREAPPELKSVLSPGAPYLWRVARVNANGEEADPSALTPFSVRLKS